MDQDDAVAARFRMEGVMARLDERMKILLKMQEESAVRDRALDQRIDKLVNEIHDLISRIPPRA